MSIGVHGESDAGMPKPGANRLDVCSLLEHPRAFLLHDAYLIRGSSNNIPFFNNPTRKYLAAYAAVFPELVV